MPAQFSTLLRLSDGLAIDLSNELLRKAKVGISSVSGRDPITHAYYSVTRSCAVAAATRYDARSSAICIACRMLHPAHCTIR